MTALDKQAREFAEKLCFDANCDPYADYDWGISAAMKELISDRIAAFATQVREQTVEICAAVVERQILKRPENSDYVNPYGFAAAIRRLNAAPRETTEQEER